MLATVYFRDGQSVTGSLTSWDDDSVHIDNVAYFEWEFMDVASADELAELD